MKILFVRFSSSLFCFPPDLQYNCHKETIMTGVEQPRSTIAGNTSRLSQWLALGFFVSIALIALTTRYNDFETENAVVKWALSVLCITLGISGLAIIASCTMPDKFTGTQMEGGMVRMR